MTELLNQPALPAGARAKCQGAGPRKPDTLFFLTNAFGCHLAIGCTRMYVTTTVNIMVDQTKSRLESACTRHEKGKYTRYTGGKTLGNSLYELLTAERDGEG